MNSQSRKLMALLIALSMLLNIGVVAYADGNIAQVIEFDTQGGSFLPPKYISNGDVLGTVAIPVRVGYEFKGWNTKADGTGTDYNDSTIIDSTIKLYAIWAPSIYNPEYDETQNNEDSYVPGSSYLDNEEEYEIVIVDEEIPIAVPELNKKNHIQYIQGYPDNTLRPEAYISREEVAAVFYRLLTDEYRNSIKTTAHNFSDISVGRWSRRHIATLANGGIIKGYEDGSFRPSEYIKRAEVATIASRFDNLSPFEADRFSDISGHWANEFINSASKKGWIHGNPDGTFKPDEFITRAEFVTLVNNVLDRKVKKEDILLDAKQFPDLLESKWYYEAMQEAINSHHYIRKDDGFEEWTEIYYPEPEL